MTFLLLSMSLIDEVKRKVELRINGKRQSVAHRMDHFERVLTHALSIAQTMDSVNIEVLSLAVFLHDVNQPFDDKANHVQLSKDTAREILNEVGCPENLSKLVLDSIVVHSTETVVVTPPTTIEGKILFDADKLDLLGPVGIARVFAFFGQSSKSIQEAAGWYYKRIEFLKNNMQTIEGKRQFENNLPYMYSFLNKLRNGDNNSAA